MGPTVCELDGPIPTLNRSKALMVIGPPSHVTDGRLIYQYDSECMSVTLLRQDFWSTSIYDREVTAVPIELDSAPVSLADRAYLAIRDQLIMLDIQPGEPIDDDQLAKSSGWAAPRSVRR